MAEPTLTDELITLINSEENNNTAPTRCKITKIYTGNTYVDVETNIGTLNYVECIGTPTVNKTGIIIYLDGDLNQPIVIT